MAFGWQPYNRLLPWHDSGPAPGGWSNSPNASLLQRVARKRERRVPEEGARHPAQNTRQTSRCAEEQTRSHAQSKVQGCKSVPILEHRSREGGQGRGRGHPAVVASYRQ